MTPRQDHLIARPTLAQRLGSHPLPSTAPCAGQWYLTDLPSYHGKMSPDALYRQMLPALQMCARCPFAGMGGECFQRTAPSPYHDGVVGGVVLRNGKPLRLRKIVQAAA